MKEETRIPRAQLAKGTESTPVVWSLVSAAESDALLVVDRANSSLKHVRLASGAPDVRVVYRSAAGYSLRGAAFVADAPSGGRTQSVLLAAEMQSDARAATMAYSLAVAEPRAGDGTWAFAQRFALDSAPTALDDSSFPSLSEVHSSRVLCAVSRSTALDVFAVPSARAARREACVPLGFALLCFTCGVCDGVTLLFACDMDSICAHSGGAGRRATRAAAAAPRRRRRPTPLAHRRPPVRRRVERAVGDACSARVACVARRAARRAPRRHSHRSRRQHMDQLLVSRRREDSAIRL